MFKDMRTDKLGTQHFTDEQLSGTCVRFYHIPDRGERTNLFGVEVVFPKVVMDEINMDYADEDNPDGNITMGQLMEVVSILTKQAQLHPNCVEITNFDGTKHDVSDIGLEQLLEAITRGGGESMAKAQYDRELAAGTVPTGMSFEDWLEVADPDDLSSTRVLH